MNAWDHLPNARHIDWVLASLKQHPEIWAATRVATRQAARDASWAAARDAILALIGYDDCANLFDMPGEQLKTWALLTEKPAAVLLVPAAIARERIRELEQV